MLGKILWLVFPTIIGGEIKEYTGMMAESREQSMMRMKEKAKELGADGIVGVRFQTSMILSGTAELLVYGTAVKLDDSQ
ncbi:MAG: hypothetical protein Ct9H300mP18_12390 [Candidatus Neomarinimicrobiota bacterium]|nr:MAG: hypothetical protein Ct9H300mP18_12390 [Candidatus Neomarinimicrobiota bacterium]